MVEIRPLASHDPVRFGEIATGYTTAERYVVRRDEADAHTTFALDLIALAHPFTKVWEWSAADHAVYQRAVAECGCSFGAMDGGDLVGVAIAEPRAWHDDLWVHEFHVHPDRRGQGIGGRLMDALAGRAREMRLRLIACETQNTNVPAVRFYRRQGFEMAGIDLWLYPPELGETALFMKRRAA